MEYRIKLLFFIESLCFGGKERRLVELLTYLKNKPGYDLLVVLTKKEIHFTKFLDLKIPYVVVQRKAIKKDPRPFYLFFQVCKKFKPDMIHVWGSLNALYSLPAVICQDIPLINGIITNAPPRISRGSIAYWKNQMTFKLSSIVLANSLAGLDSYDAPRKRSQVVYNGINLDRFRISDNAAAIKEKFGITTQYSLIMVASFSDKKDHDLLLDVAKCIYPKRKDISMVAVGDGEKYERIKNRIKNEQISNVVLTGKIDPVEPLVSAADIGVLFSPRGEGISNSILEYMALGKPVVATNAGGSKEIIKDGVTGYLIGNMTSNQIADMVIDLIDDEKKRLKMGQAGKALIEKSFALDRMGAEFETIFSEVYRQKNKKTN